MTGWPQTFNGVTYTEAMFAGNGYADALPRLLRDLSQHYAQFSQSASADEITVAGSGDISITVAANKNYAVGQPIRIARTSDPADVWMTGPCLAYNPTTGALSVRRTAAAGSGTYTDWTVSVDGGSGPAGATGPTGPTPITVTTSAANLPIQVGSTGSFALAAATDLGLGSPVVLSLQSDVSKFMYGLLTAKSGVDVTVNVLAVNGTGTQGPWHVALSGTPGVQGPIGPAGVDGRVPGFDEAALERAIRLASMSAFRL